MSRTTVASFGIKLAMTGLGFLISILLARSIGTSGYGIYAYALAVATLLGMPAELGLPTLLVRSLVAFQASGHRGLIRGLMRWSYALIVAASGIAAVTGLIYIMFTAEAGSGERSAVLLALLLVPIVSLNRARQAAMQGLGRVIAGQVPEAIILPVGFIAAILLLAPVTSVPRDYVGAYLVCAALACLVGLIISHRTVASRVEGAAPVYRSRIWLREVGTLAMASMAGAMMGTIDVVLLGLTTSNHEIGLYRVALSGAAFVAFPLSAVHAVVQPQVAGHWYRRDHRAMAQALTRSARWTASAGFALLCVYFLIGEWLLTKVYGPAFAQAWVPLIILSAGQTVALILGSMGMALNMTSNEGATLRSTVAGLVAIVLGVLLLAPGYGAVGGAIATASGMVVAAAAYWWTSVRRLGLDGSVLGRRLDPPPLFHAPPPT